MCCLLALMHADSNPSQISAPIVRGAWERCYRFADHGRQPAMNSAGGGRQTEWSYLTTRRFRACAMCVPERGGISELSEDYSQNVNLTYRSFAFYEW